MKKRNNIKSFGVILLILLILTNSILPSLAAEMNNQEAYLASLKQLRDNIYNKYKKDANSQWEWANIGFYEGLENGMEKGFRKGPEDLPKGLDLYKIIGELDSRSIAGMGSTVAGTVISLTAMGIDCANLKPFEVDGKPFKTRDMKHATNLVKIIYDAKPGGINFCTWGLIALDMGNYSTPIDANSTREKLLETILNHEYGSDGFAVDMVAMLIQSLYPYQNDPIYKDRVKDKLEHGLDLFLGHRTANKVEPMREDFMFNSWGAVNSESTAHVIIALCNMGIDAFSDYRFSRGENDNLIYNWVNRFATNSRDGFGHTNNQYNGIGTEQGMYALQCYINFKENGGKKPYSLWYDGVPFNFGEQNLDIGPILSFELLGYKGEVSHLSNTITIIIENQIFTEELKNLKPDIVLGEDYTIEELNTDFTEDVVYNIEDKNGKVTSYNVNVINGSSWFNKFVLRGVEGEINKARNQIKFEFPYGTYVEDVLPNLIEIKSEDKEPKLVPDINTPLDFSKEESFTYTIDNGKSVEYEIILSYRENKGNASIREFSIGEHKAKIEGKSIVFTLPKGMSKEEFISKNKNIAPVIKGYYETIDPNPNLGKGYRNSIDNYLQEYVLTDEDGNVNLYNIKFEDEGKTDPPVKEPEEKLEEKLREKELIIESFKIGNVEAEIDNEQKIIYIELPYELDLSYVVPIIISTKGSLYPISGTPMDLRKPIVYTLYGDGNIKYYKLKINILPSEPATKLWDYIEKYSGPQEYQAIGG